MELIRADGILLRTWGEDDLAAFYDIYSRWEVMRWLGPQPRTALANRDEARQRLARWRAKGATLTAPLGLWAVAATEPGRADAAPVGTVLLMPLDDDTGPTGDVEVGWHLHPGHEGQGLATRSARALLTLAADAGHRRVLALTDPDNLKSQAVCNRLAMADEGLTNRWFGLTTRQFAWSAPPREAI